MITHKKIAELCGVSVATVSKALSGSKEVSEETARRVLKIAMQHHYFQNKKEVRRDYAKNYRESIAILCPEIISIHYATIVTMLKTEIEGRGGRVLLWLDDFNSEKSQEILQYIITNQLADGVITIETTPAMDTAGIPLVSIKSSAGQHQSAMEMDMRAGIEQAVDHFLALGHTRIGFVGEAHTLIKENLFRQICVERRLPVLEGHIIAAGTRFYEIGREAVDTLLHTDPAPTAILAAYDEIAISLLYELRLRGIRVPEDISIIGINDIPDAAYTTPPLTTVRTFFNEQCETIVALLYKKISGTSKANPCISIQGQLIVRESTARREAAVPEPASPGGTTS